MKKTHGLFIFLNMAAYSAIVMALNELITNGHVKVMILIGIFLFTISNTLIQIIILEKLPVKDTRNKTNDIVHKGESIDTKQIQ